MHTYLRRCDATLGATGAETSLLLTAYYIEYSPHPILAADGHYIRNSSCMTLLWLHHNHKMSISYHKNASVGSHRSVGRWLIFYVFLGKNISTKLIGYQQPTCLCVKMEFVAGTISLSCELYPLPWMFSFMWVRHKCVRKMAFRFACAALWKLHG